MSRRKVWCCRKPSALTKIICSPLRNAPKTPGETLTLYPFGQIARTGTPQLTDLFILHEGPIGFFGEEGLTEIDYDELLSDGPVAKRHGRLARHDR